MSKKDNINELLITIKMKAESSLASLAASLGISKEGVRQHLAKLTDEGLVEVWHQAEGVGRPTAYYRLTAQGQARFPDSHAQITVDILQSVKNLLGDNALDLLIADREKQTYARYASATRGQEDIADKLQTLTELRTQEGYMATWHQEDDYFFFTENHCPICAAATQCQGFCRAELKNFQELFGQAYAVERTQHIISDGQRCVYRITPKIA